MLVARSERGDESGVINGDRGQMSVCSVVPCTFDASFTDDIHDDMNCLDESIYARLHMVPFNWRRSAEARKHLIIRFGTYIAQVEGNVQ
ncbi:hypothetical protein BKA82DRAFT_1001188 [Pisolithus tinctorius]|uniref:Uncharacterized protein n=1 Tax=Pisolithus tinctorius Marx 270 TaxID=870435 RepID=A0A0C3P889_PISTI|nr:hypothetical protein BKA82DRAFT_1001188 [Pisolithus tinctorius]KIO03704.1 hypothetical protein M404DRAFT_1001188 [Pisolithus tinctorius Marx 270]